MFHLGVAKNQHYYQYLARKWCPSWDSHGKFIPVGDLIDSMCFFAKPSLRKHKQKTAQQRKNRYKSIQGLVDFFLVHYTTIDPAWWLYMLLKNHSWNPEQHTAMMDPSLLDAPVARINVISCPWRSRTYRPSQRLRGGDERTPPSQKNSMHGIFIFMNGLNLW